MILNLDRNHSFVEFEVEYLGIMKQKGTFDSYVATMNYDYNSKTNSKIELLIASNSLNTKNKIRDNHLTSPDFIDSKKYPEIQFSSNEFKIGTGPIKIPGTLRLNGFEKEITIQVNSSGIVHDWEGKSRLGLFGSLRINRLEFGITGGSSHNRRFVKERTISNLVKVDFSLQFIIRNSTSWDPALDFIEELEEEGLSSCLQKYRPILSENGTKRDMAFVTIITACNKLIYDNGRVNDAIQLLEMLLDVNEVGQKDENMVIEKLVIAHYIAEQNTKSSAYLNSLRARDGDKSLIAIMEYLLN